MTDAVVQLNHFRKPASQIENRWAFSAMRPRPSEEIQSSAAYALRSPLSQMKSLVTTLLRTDVDWDDEARKEFITRIDQEIDRIAAIVESPLTVTTEATPQMLADSGSQAAVENRMGLVELSKMLEAALVVGASGGNTIRNLLTGSNHDQVWQSIKVSLADQIERSQEPAARLAREIVAHEGPEELSDRELDVLRLIGLGRSNKQIANELAITSNTVKTHVSSILAKLGVESRTQAALQMPGILAGSRMRPAMERGPSVRRAAM
jgi:DNA-binding NarL/FixJ family response regulator